MAGLFDTRRPIPPSILGGYTRPSLLGSYAPPLKRKAYFAFHYDDIMRVNVVRNAWKITHPDSTSMRSFYDSSLWESKKLEGDEAVKRLIREGVCYTSAVCVLVGAQTWQRRWVKYEIARAVIDERGLLAVHINSIRHHQLGSFHQQGLNPLDYMGVGKVEGQYYLYEKRLVQTPTGWQWSWERYGDYTQAVRRPRWLADPAPGYLSPLSTNASTFDYIAGSGHQHIGTWIDRAAQGAGR